jgi:hypothetical protein
MWGQPPPAVRSSTARRLSGYAGNLTNCLALYNVAVNRRVG